MLLDSVKCSSEWAFPVFVLFCAGTKYESLEYRMWEQHQQKGECCAEADSTGRKTLCEEHVLQEWMLLKSCLSDTSSSAQVLYKLPTATNFPIFIFMGIPVGLILQTFFWYLLWSIMSFFVFKGMEWIVFAKLNIRNSQREFQYPWISHVVPHKWGETSRLTLSASTRRPQHKTKNMIKYFLTIQSKRMVSNSSFLLKSKKSFVASGKFPFLW